MTQKSDENQRLLDLFEKCRNNPALFARAILGVTLWSKQKEIVEAVMLHDRIAVKSGHKVGKSKLCAVIALWFATMRRKGRVIMTSSSARQVELVLWREVMDLYNNAPLLKHLGGKCNLLPSSGLTFPGGSEIRGFTTDEPEKMAGISGENVLYIVDEASGFPEKIFEAIEGNRAGDAQLIMISNPTQTSGTFYNAFRDPTVAPLWKTFSISSEESPNITGEAKIPGLATDKWVQEKRIEWGPDYTRSPLYLVRVRGDFPISGETNVMSLDLVSQAIRQRPGIGHLTAGLDPSGEGADDSVLCVRRGLGTPDFHVWQKLNGDQLADKVIRTLTDARNGDEYVTVNVDSIGLGASVYQSLRRTAPKWLSVVGVKSSYVSRYPEKFVNLRDELWWGIAEWLRLGGSLPKDPKLETELTAVQYSLDPKRRIKIESKKDLKARIKRSPDRSDSLALAIYEGGVNLSGWLTSAKKLTPSLQRRERKTV